jgi:hypothetical protein
MSDFMIVNATKDINFLNLDLIEKVKQLEATTGQVEVFLSSGDRVALSKADSKVLVDRLNARSLKQAA